MSLEAESREAVFKELAQRGITANRIEQAKGKAKPRRLITQLRFRRLWQCEAVRWRLLAFCI